MKAINKYFVSYTFNAKNGKSGNGNGIYDMDFKLADSESITALQKYIEETINEKNEQEGMWGVYEVIINNFILV